MALSSRELVHYYMNRFGVSPAKADKLADAHVFLYGSKHPDKLTADEIKMLKKVSK